MKKIYQICLLGLALCQFTVVFAHAVVTDHSLKLSPIYPNRPDKVALTFNSKIEIGLSQVFLVRAGDKHEALVFTKGDKQGLINIDMPALEPGKYALKFKVFAADGHLTEDVIHFTVASDTADPIQQNLTETK